MILLEEKWNGILYEGGFDNFSINGSFHMEKEVLYKNNPTLEAQKRLDMAYLLLTNPKMIETMQKNNTCFFHGTNANALPNILKYGLNSVNRSIENNLDITTGEEWSRINGKRSFVSLTDCLNIAMSYANMMPNDNCTNTLLNFGVIIGASLEDMSGLTVSGINSDVSEVGVIGNLPIEHIKFLAVPNDKVDFVKKMIGNANIEIVSIDIRDAYFNRTFIEKLNLLEPNTQNTESIKTPYPTYFKDDIAPVVATRKTSKIRGIFESLKAKIHHRTNTTNEKNNSERS